MEEPDRDPKAGRPVRFVGDLDDPWVVSIADALPDWTARRHFPGDLPDGFADPSIPGESPGVVVLHRAVLTTHDAEQVACLRAGREPPLRVVLCFGPHTRHVELERWSVLVDASLPEATARDTIARRVWPPEPGSRRQLSGPRGRISVISTNWALRRTLADVCEAGGYPVTSARDWHDAPLHGPAVWDVPVLEPGWPDDLSRRARFGPVVALIGFADRALVTEARARGAVACLELPVDLADLASVLDRLPSPRPELAHELPPPPVARRRGGATPGRVPSRWVADAGRDA